MFKNPLLTMAICSSLCCATVSGQQRDQDKDRAQRSENQSQRQESQQAQAELPQSLQELDLTSSQKQSIKSTLQQHNEKLKKTWREFQEAHARSIELEASWLAAVRDTLSESDQQNFDRQRQASRGSDSAASNKNGSSQGQRENRPRNQKGDAQSQDRSADSAAQQNEQERDNLSRAEQTRSDDPQQLRNRDRQSPQSRRQAASNRKSAENGVSQSGDSEGQSGDTEGLVIIAVTSPVAYTRGASQSTEQKQHCSEACRRYEQELAQVWQNVKQLHNELVQIEADRMSAVERELTEEQLQQLRERRQQPSDSGRRVAGRAR